jgi:D-ribose pyranase
VLRSGILNPQINSLLSRVRHTNTLVIADRGFPYWPTIETADLSLVDGIPRVLDVLQAIRTNFVIGRITMAEEFRLHNTPAVVNDFAQAMAGVEVHFEPHIEFKKEFPERSG